MKYINRVYLKIRMIVVLGAFTIISLHVFGQVAHEVPFSESMARVAMRVWMDSCSTANHKLSHWNYQQGLILKGMKEVWYATGNADFYNHIQKSVDLLVQDDGTIKGYPAQENNNKNLQIGPSLLLVHQVSGKAKYLGAATHLRQQWDAYPRTKEGELSYKIINAEQASLQGFYMWLSFYAAYAHVMHEESTFNDIARQFAQLESLLKHSTTGAQNAAHNKSHTKRGENASTVKSTQALAIAMGWYGMALVDALDYFPKNHVGRVELMGILGRFIEAAANVQDGKSGLWNSDLTAQGEKENYKDGSASCMLVYTIAKAIRHGYVSSQYSKNAILGFAGIQKEFLSVEEGQINRPETVHQPIVVEEDNRHPAIAYQIGGKVVVNDPNSLGALILCASEMEIMNTPQPGKSKTVMLDRYYNAEKRKDAGGVDAYFHYTWNELSNPGFSLFGNIFERYGATLTNLDDPPSGMNLANADVYIIVDADHQKDNASFNVPSVAQVEAIRKWVKKGGSLLLMANDSANCNIKSFNSIAAPFGIFFTDTSINMVKNDHYPTGLVNTGVGSVFLQNITVFLKEISTISISGKSRPVLKKDGHIIMAESKYGKGKVLAVVDPWLYNEYLDGRKLKNQFDNFAAAQQLALWLLRP